MADVAPDGVGEIGGIAIYKHHAPPRLGFPNMLLFRR